MRVDFGNAIARVMAENPRAFFVTGDLGFNAFESLVDKHAERFLNAGVAEQNMIGVAAGMALTGVQPWVYSIIPFGTIRCLEQIRNDVCFHDLPVRIVGNGGGYTYGVMGSTHHALEDLGVLKALPNMRLFFPCSNNQVAAAVATMNELPGPTYLRLSISGYARNDAPIHENEKTLTRQYLAAAAAKPSHGVTLIAAGHAAQIALTALAEGAFEGKALDIFSVARFPFDLASDARLVESVERTKRVVFVEEHYEAGGMGESLRIKLPQARVFTPLAASYHPDQRYGSSRFHLQQTRLTPDAIAKAVTAASTA